LAFWPHLTAVIDFICASLRRYQFSLRLRAIINFSLPHGKNRFHSALRQFTPHGDNQFFFASPQELISFCLTAVHASRRYQFSLCLMAIIDFSSPHGDNQFFFASQQESISFRLTAIHASRGY
jgi:hypothetical protein